MKTDFYTKAVLTVIAICLTIIVMKQVNIIPSANANTLDAGLESNMNYGLVPLNADGSINVNVMSTSSTMDVNIVEVRGKHLSYGKLPVIIIKNEDK